MPQQLQILKCFSCSAFQVHMVKKIPKWECKICGEKQSVKKIYGRGSGKDCRLYVQQLNQQHLESNTKVERECVASSQLLDSGIDADHVSSDKRKCNPWDEFLSNDALHAESGEYKAKNAPEEHTNANNLLKSVVYDKFHINNRLEEFTNSTDDNLQIEIEEIANYDVFQKPAKRYKPSTNLQRSMMVIKHKNLPKESASACNNKVDGKLKLMPAPLSKIQNANFEKVSAKTTYAIRPFIDNKQANTGNLKCNSSQWAELMHNVSDHNTDTLECAQLTVSKFSNNQECDFYNFQDSHTKFINSDREQKILVPYLLSNCNKQSEFLNSGKNEKYYNENISSCVNVMEKDITPSDNENNTDFTAAENCMFNTQEPDDLDSLLTF